MDIETILQELEQYRGKLPRAALEGAIDQQESITPHLLEALRFAHSRAGSLPDGYWLHTWAMFLLAQFREPRAYPLVVDLLDLPSRELRELHGDLLTEDAHRIAASVYDGDPSPLQRLAEKPEADEYARDAALGAMVCLVAAGRRSREETLEYFRHLYSDSSTKPGSFFWSGLVMRSTDLYPDLVASEIRQAYERNLVDPFFISLDGVEKVLARGKDAALTALSERSDYQLVNDVIRETEWWACFRPQEPSSQAPDTLVTPSAPSRSAGQSWTGSWRPATSTEIVGPKPGRNDPCPCGSGLKYKRCCLKRA